MCPNKNRLFNYLSTLYFNTLDGSCLLSRSVWLKYHSQAMLEVVFSTEDFKNQHKVTIWKKSSSHYTMISVSKGNKQKYAHKLQKTNNGSDGMGFLWTSHSFFLEASSMGPCLLPFFAIPSCCIPDPHRQSTHRSQCPSGPIISQVVIDHIRWKVFSVCFKMLKLWSPSDMLIRCGCLLGSVHTSAQSHAPFQFWKCVPKNSWKHSHWLSVFLYKYCKHFCL